MFRRIFHAGLLALAFCLSCSSPPTIALLTDYGWNDPYAGAVQGVILSINPNVRLVNVTHSVPNYDIREASYLLATTAKEFPKGTIFLAIIDPGVGSARKAVIVETIDQKYFVGPDNGLFTDVVRSFGFKRAVEISNVLWFRRGAISSTFHGRDIFGPAAAHLTSGKKMEDAGPALQELVLLERVKPEQKEGNVVGEILHRDHYGNLVTNVPATVLVQTGWRAGMDLEFVVKQQVVRAKFAERYNAVEKGEFVLVLNGQGLLELARYLDSAGDSLQAAAGDSILVRTAGSAATPATPTTTASRVSAPLSNRTR